MITPREFLRGKKLLKQEAVEFVISGSFGSILLSELLEEYNELNKSSGASVDRIGKHVIEFQIGDSVYLKTDSEQRERLVTAIHLRDNGLCYFLSYLTNESSHYAFEITKERDIVKATSS